MPVPKFYHQCDPAAPQDNYVWHYVYLHGWAEDRNSKIAHDAEYWSALPTDDDNRPWAAPDLFVCDQMMPGEPGEYRADHYGLPVIVVIAMHLGTILGGRAAYEDDPQALAHARKPTDWR